MITKINVENITKMNHMIIGATGGNPFFKMSILELGPFLFGGIEGIIDFLRQHHRLAS